MISVTIEERVVVDDHDIVVFASKCSHNTISVQRILILLESVVDVAYYVGEILVVFVDVSFGSISVVYFFLEFLI